MNISTRTTVVIFGCFTVAFGISLAELRPGLGWLALLPAFGIGAAVAAVGVLCPLTRRPRASDDPITNPCSSGRRGHFPHVPISATVLALAFAASFVLYADAGNTALRLVYGLVSLGAAAVAIYGWVGFGKARRMR